MFYRKISEPFFLNEQDAEEKLQSRLDRLTRKGSGDDVSVAAAICVETFLAEPKFSSAQRQSQLEVLNMKIEGHHASIQNNVNALRQNEEKYEEEYKRHKNLEVEMERIKRIKEVNERELQEMLLEKKLIESESDV